MKHGAKRKWSWKQFSCTPVTVAGAFLLSLMAFGLVLLLPVFIRQIEPDTDSAEVLGERGVQRCLWVVLHEDNKLSGLVRVCTDTCTQTISVTGVPLQAEITDDVTLTTVAALYEKQGENAVLVLEELPIVSLSVDAFAALVGSVSGNLPLTLPQPVEQLPQGELTLTALQVAQVLRFEDWEQGGVEQALIHAKLIAAFINRTLTDSKDLYTVFGTVAGACEPRLHVSQFVMVQDELQTLCKANTGDICIANVLPGYMVGVGERQRYVLENQTFGE